MPRELVETTYQREMPSVIDDQRVRTAFGVAAAPVEQALAETAAWARVRHVLWAVA